MIYKYPINKFNNNLENNQSTHTNNISKNIDLDTKLSKR